MLGKKLSGCDYESTNEQEANVKLNPFVHHSWRSVDVHTNHSSILFHHAHLSLYAPNHSLGDDCHSAIAALRSHLLVQSHSGPLVVLCHKVCRYVLLVYQGWISSVVHAL